MAATRARVSRRSGQQAKLPPTRGETPVIPATHACSAPLAQHGRAHSGAGTQAGQFAVDAPVPPGRVVAPSPVPAHAGPAAADARECGAGIPSAARYLTRRPRAQGKTRIKAVRTARRPRAMRGRRSRCRCPARGARQRRPGVTLRSAYATDDPGTAPAIMAAARKVAKTGTAATSYSRWLPYQAPLIPATDDKSPSLRRAEPTFHETRDATCRRSTRQPRGGLPQAEPGIT